MTYQAKVYRTQGAAELVITSSGTLNMDGTMDVSGTIGTSGSGTINLETGGTLTAKSGSHVAIASGSSMAVATDLEIASGGKVVVKSGATLDVQSGSSATIATPLEFSSGGYVKNVFSAKTKLNKATAIIAGSVNSITASSTNSECALPAPVAGASIFAVCIARTSPGVYTLASTVDFAGTATNKLSFDAAGERVLLYGTSAAWSIAYGTATTTS